MVIDSHVQFWRYERGKFPWMTNNMEILQRDYPPPEFSLTAKRNGIDGVIAVQTELAELETMYLMEWGAKNQIIKGIVGKIDLQRKDVNEKLIYFSQNDLVKGFFIDLKDGNDAALNKPDFLYGIGQLQALNYTCDLSIKYTQLAEAIIFFSRFPEQKCVIDNCAFPDISNKEMNEWTFFIKEAAKHPNTYCKVSGLFTQASWHQWSVAEFYPYLDVIFESFGIDRLLYASDWPRILLSGMYVQWKSLLEKYMEGFEEEQKEKVLGLNAMNFYNLNE